MARVQCKIILLWVAYVLLILSVILWGSRKVSSSPGFTINQSRNEADLTQIFVPKGTRYQLKDGKIYECITRDLYSRVEVRHRARDFRSDTWSNPGEDHEHRARSFREIFENQRWVGEKSPTLDKFSPEYRASGGGSTLEAAQGTIALLHCLVERMKVALGKSVITMVDILCGDFYWMRHFVGARTDIRYTGIDIVPALITRHKINFRNMTHAQFKNHDIVTAGLNQSYDVILCRDMLQHLTNADAMKILEHFSKSGSKLLVTTNFSVSKNKDVAINGRFRRLNLMVPPISLVPPVCSITEGRIKSGSSAKQLSIWTLPLHVQQMV